ncbi:protein artemis-like isoform X2 [Plodia interpunctella]|uniref:protein artemis-like isoform X2 n=1 Tax=Plodia interpunctella TaxID=58824 RepID=UPI002367C5EE|nr:protein artemis-like isoform X2 [Plodia interpunctella]
MGYGSSFNGTIDEIPGISVDNFEKLDKSAYFLSHIHSDHTVGLLNTVKYGDNGNATFAEYLSKNDVYVYMSEVTAIIFEYEFGDLAAFVKPLGMGKHQVISLPATENYEETHMDVTLIPAGHCLGSSMILFQNNRKTVLYTGDFRYTQHDVKKIRDLHNPNDRTEPIHIDTMYVDTTFITLDKTDLPKRSDSINYLLREVNSWLNKGDEYKVALDTPAKYGYECVFNEIYDKLGRKVYVTDAKWRLYSKMFAYIPGVTNDKNLTDIHNCSFYSKNHSKCEIPNVNKYKFLHIRLSAMKWVDYNIEFIPIDKQTENNLSVCFSTHCSRSELVYFVNHFSPKNVVGFPNEFKFCKQPKKNVDVVLSPVKRRKMK